MEFEINNSTETKLIHNPESKLILFIPIGIIQ